MKKFKKILFVANIIQLSVIVIGLVCVLIVVKRADQVVKVLADFLIHKDDVHEADIIVVLGGEDTKKRIDQGVDLLNDKLAPQILYSCGGTYKQAIKRFDKYGLSKDNYIIEDKSTTTYENALFVKDIVLEKGYQSFILVATPQQSKRADFVFKKVFKDTDIEIMTYPVENTDFVPSKIMRNKFAKEQFVLELGKLVYYYYKYLWM